MYFVSVIYFGAWYLKRAQDVVVGKQIKIIRNNIILSAAMCRIVAQHNLT